METLYTNGTIVTMGVQEEPEAVLTGAGRIRAVGRRESLRRMAPKAREVDLGGCALLPAFLDAHSHFLACANSFLQVSLAACGDFEEVGQRIRQFIRDSGIRPGGWVLARGYDPDALAQRRRPPLALLDEWAPENPLVVQHASGHAGLFNTPALERLGVTVRTQAPSGGRIDTADGALTGCMEENAFFMYIKKVPMAGMDELLDACGKAQAAYAARGITTVQEGMAVSGMIPLYRELLERRALELDVVAYAAIDDAEAFYEAFPQSAGRYDGNLKLGGCKIFLDGSPQGRTAWMRTPYRGQEPPYCGYGTMEDEAVLAALETAVKRRMQLLAHCNGDAAARQFLNAAGRVSDPAALAALRPVMIHAQLLDLDQLEQVRRMGILPSFFVAHVYHWGDAHIRNFGRERAARISPAASALRAGLRFTFHQDVPVIEPDMLETVWCAANRVTRDGVVLGPEERISVKEALKAVTIHAAYQYFEEDRKGSIEPGKDADFTVLSRSPLAVPPEELRDIRVLGTIRRDVPVFGG